MTLLLCACTSGFLYNRLDWLLHVYFSNQVTLTSAQSQELRRSLREFHAWHRSSELPRYAGFLETLAGDSRAALSRERIDEARLAVEDLWRDLLLQASPEIARWLASLDASQLDELFASLAEKDEELREEFCDDDPERLRRRREKSFIGAVEDWTGRLSAQQKSLIRDGLVDLQSTQCGWVATREAFRREFRALIDVHGRDSDFPARVARFLSRPEERWSAEYRAAFESNRDRIVSLLAELDATFTPRQRERLVTRLQDFARDFRDLAARPRKG